MPRKPYNFMTKTEKDELFAYFMATGENNQTIAKLFNCSQVMVHNIVSPRLKARVDASVEAHRRAHDWDKSNTDKLIKALKFETSIQTPIAA